MGRWADMASYKEDGKRVKGGQLMLRRKLLYLPLSGSSSLVKARVTKI